jgi:hypothetical protein
MLVETGTRLDKKLLNDLRGGKRKASTSGPPERKQPA